MDRRQREIKKLERWLQRFNPANPYMAFFHVGTSWEEVNQARQELKILKQQEVNDGNNI
tara:strand:- start:70 stop:246 length:177 start_codon:yes stop_codon:yes gene_type:complete